MKVSESFKAQLSYVKDSLFFDAQGNETKDNDLGPFLELSEEGSVSGWRTCLSTLLA